MGGSGARSVSHGRKRQKVWPSVKRYGPASKSMGLASKGIEQASNDVPADMHLLVRKHSPLLQ